MKINANKRNTHILGITLLVIVASLAIGIGLQYINNTAPQTADIPSIKPTQEPASIEPIESLAPGLVADSKVQPEVPELIESPQPAPNASTTEPASATTSIQEGQPQNDIKPTEPPKPTPKGDIIDKTQPPSYDEKDAKPSNSEPKVGDRNDKGEIYIAGFGWIKEIGESEGTIIDSDGDINKQVGTMD